MSSEFLCGGILFDCDGVLVDSDLSVFTAWTRWARDLGLDPATVASIPQGRRSADIVAGLVAERDRVAAAELIDRYEVEDAESVTAIPGAAELLAALPADRWAVVTSGKRMLATARLSAAGLPVPFVLITAEDVARGKPDPEGYLAGAAGLGCVPSDTIVLEDAAAGVVAARAAGVAAVVGVGMRDDLPDVDARVPDLTTLRWTGRGLSTA